MQAAAHIHSPGGNRHLRIRFLLFGVILCGGLVETGVVWGY